MSIDTFNQETVSLPQKWPSKTEAMSEDNDVLPPSILWAGIRRDETLLVTASLDPNVWSSDQSLQSSPRSSPLLSSSGNSVASSSSSISLSQIDLDDTDNSKKKDEGEDDLVEAIWQRPAQVGWDSVTTPPPGHALYRGGFYRGLKFHEFVPASVDTNNPGVEGGLKNPHPSDPAAQTSPVSQPMTVWAFAIVYDTRRLSESLAQAFLEQKLVALTQVIRQDDPVWTHSEQPLACQAVFEPILQQRMDEMRCPDGSVDWSNAVLDDGLELSNRIICNNRTLLRLEAESVSRPVIKSLPSIRGFFSRDPIPLSPSKTLETVDTAEASSSSCSGNNESFENIYDHSDEDDDVISVGDDDVISMDGSFDDANPREYEFHPFPMTPPHRSNAIEPAVQVACSSMLTEIYPDRDNTRNSGIFDSSGSLQENNEDSLATNASVDQIVSWIDELTASTQHLPMRHSLPPIALESNVSVSAYGKSTLFDEKDDDEFQGSERLCFGCRCWWTASSTKNALV